MMWRIVAGAVAVCLFLPAQSAMAAPALKDRGLLISPLRAFEQVDANKTQSSSITVANLTKNTIQISLSVQQFSVTDYSYNYHFKPAQYDWIRLSVTQLELSPQKSKTIPYQIHVPPGAAPGGQYFTIVATTSFTEGDIKTKVQAASLLYLTVKGQLDTSSKLLANNLPRIAFGKDIPFNLTIKNTGNTHFFAYASGELRGFTARQDQHDATHLLLPNSVRIVSNTIPAPALPGVYRATYGYRTDGGPGAQQSSYILYIPPWAVAIPVGLIWIGLTLRKRRRKQKPPTDS